MPDHGKMLREEELSEIVEVDSSSLTVSETRRVELTSDSIILLD